MDPAIQKSLVQYLNQLQLAGLSDMAPLDAEFDMTPQPGVASAPKHDPVPNPQADSGTPAPENLAAPPPSLVPAPQPTKQQPEKESALSSCSVRPSSSSDSRQALLQLAEEVAQCNACQDLAPQRQQTVFGVGSPNPRLCFLGEGPGADEDRLGEPFVGRAGKLLDDIISACQMKREDVYILNTVKCRPPGNRNPREDELANCRHFWERQLQILQPEFICCLGAVAAKTLLNTEQSIARMRQKFFSYEKSQVMVTYHPAYLLRTPDAKAKTWSDMKMLMSAMGVEL